MESIINSVSETAYTVKHDIRLKDKAFFDTELTGDLDFDSIDMFYLILELMSKFKIKFSADDLVNYNFNTINRISSCISSKKKQ